MDTGFKDNIKPKKVEPPFKPIDGKNSPWDFRCPTYDERSSCFVQAGTNYGVGHKTPVGNLGQNASQNAVPIGRIATLKTERD